MSQRKSGFNLIKNDFYATPEWVTLCLLAEEVFETLIIEPACGENHIVDVLMAHGHKVIGMDLYSEHGATRLDFLKAKRPMSCIVTNPPYGQRLKLAQLFVEHALELTRLTGGVVAMLLPVTFDSGKTRRHLFADCPAWKKKIIITDRIEWANIEKTNESSTDHAWFIWDWNNDSVPVNVYQSVPKN